MMKAKVLCCLGVSSLLILPSLPADFKISSFDRHGNLTWTNAYSSGICTLETAPEPNGPWMPASNAFTTGSVGRASVDIPSSTQFLRLLAVDISTNSANAFSNLVSSYGFIRTIAGNGFGRVDGSNYWQSSFEGGPATNAALSRPHFAMADNDGNVFIVDKDSHSLLKVTTDGTIHTVAGTHSPGNGSDVATYGTNVQLNSPNGEWVRGDGTVYVLDTGNGKVRRLGTNGIMTTLFTDTGGIGGGRGLWVKDDESLAFYDDGSNVKSWTPGGGFKTMNKTAFIDLGNIVVSPAYTLIVTDRGANRVYRLNGTGSRDPIAGNGSTSAVLDGTPVLASGLHGVRGVWFLPNNGYLLALHEGSQVVYVDPAGIVHIFVDGHPGATHAGDGQWFYSPGYKIGEARSVTVDTRGNVLIVENDAGYVRRIEFSRLKP